jgi:hypothetical protein
MHPYRGLYEVAEEVANSHDKEVEEISGGLRTLCAEQLGKI